MKRILNPNTSNILYITLNINKKVCINGQSDPIIKSINPGLVQDGRSIQFDSYSYANDDERHANNPLQSNWEHRLVGGQYYDLRHELIHSAYIHDFTTNERVDVKGKILHVISTLQWCYSTPKGEFIYEIISPDEIEDLKSGITLILPNCDPISTTVGEVGHNILSIMGDSMKHDLDPANRIISAVEIKHNEFGKMSKIIITSDCDTYVEETRMLFTFISDQISFDALEFIGLTEKEAKDLCYQRYLDYACK